MTGYGTATHRSKVVTQSTRLRIWGSAVRIRSGAPISEIFRANRTAIARRKLPVGDWAGTQADGSVSGAADYESGGREFESLRARQFLLKIQHLNVGTLRSFPQRSHKRSHKPVLIERRA